MHSTSETETEVEQKKVEWMKNKKNKDKATTVRTVVGGNVGSKVGSNVGGWSINWLFEFVR